MNLLVTLRRLRARRPLLAIGLPVLAGMAAAVLAERAMAAVDAERRAWGERVEVLVARHDLAPGDVLGDQDVERRRHPRAVVPPGALQDRPDGVVRQAVGAGEVLVTADLAPTTGPAALIPPGWRSAVVPTGGLPIAPGDAVEVAASGRVLGAGVVVAALMEDLSGETRAVVALPGADAPGVAAAAATGEALLLLSSGPPPAR